MIATGIEEGVPTRREGQGPANWQEVHARLPGDRGGRSRGRATRVQLEEAAELLSQLADEILILLENQVKDDKFERQ